MGLDRRAAVRRVELASLRDVEDHEFLAAARRSRDLHHPWTAAPQTQEELAQLRSRGTDGSRLSFCGRRLDDGSLVGLVNLSQVARGNFQSCYAGFCAFVPNQGQGLMRETVALVVDHAFTVERLHRVEANVQPANTRSLALVRSLGFRREGLSPRYLYIDGGWRDHERWAVTVEEWHAPDSSSSWATLPG